MHLLSSALLSLSLLLIAPSALVAQAGPAIPVAPPELRDRPTNIVLRFDSLGVPTINHQAVPWQRLRAELRAIYSGRPEKLLFLRTVPQSDSRNLERALRVAKAEGITLYLLPAGRAT